MKRFLISAGFLLLLAFPVLAKSNKPLIEKGKLALASERTPSIYQSYWPYIQSIGLSATQTELNDKQTVMVFRRHYSEITSGSSVSIKNILPETPLRFKTFIASDGKNYKVPDIISMSALFGFLQDARDTQIDVRLHLLINQNTTPAYFFYEDYDTSKPLVSTAEMNARLEWYIRTIIEYVINWQDRWSKSRNVVSSIDVISEVFSDDGTLRSGASSMWARLYGDESFAVNAFVYATRYAGDLFELCYCDYSLDLPKKLNAVIGLVEKIRAAGGKIDQIGVTSHLAVDWPEYEPFFSSIKTLAGKDLKVFLQNLDFDGVEGRENERAICESYYNFLTKCLQNSPYIYGISFRGFKREPKQQFVDLCENPLFENDYSCNDAFYNVIKAAEDFAK